MFNRLRQRLQRKLNPSVGNQPVVSFGPCIFCGEQIAETGADPLSIAVSENRGGTVIWFAHARCLAERISPNVSEGFVEPEKSNWLGHGGSGNPPAEPVRQTF